MSSSPCMLSACVSASVSLLLTQSAIIHLPLLIAVYRQSVMVAVRTVILLPFSTPSSHIPIACFSPPLLALFSPTSSSPFLSTYTHTHPYTHTHTHTLTHTHTHTHSHSLSHTHTHTHTHRHTHTLTHTLAHTPSNTPLSQTSAGP